MTDSIIVQMNGITKRFGGTLALSDMQLTLRRGEIHALVGENGAGKSTLMKTLAGAIHPDEGTITINGKETHIAGPRDSIEQGISVIYQEFVLMPDLSVAENIYIDRLPSSAGVINDKKLCEDAGRLLQSLGFGEIDPKEKVGNLTVAYQQIVEICKSLSRKTQVLVLDEPSAVLTFVEIEKLFVLLRKLKDQGLAIVYISHRMDEIFELCDTITVMKDGCYVGNYTTSEMTKGELIEKMVGRELRSLFPERNAVIGETALKVEKLNAGRMVKDVSFEVKKGEVVGFCGLVGAGRTETMRAIFGADKKDSGKIIYQGRKVWFRSPYEAVKNKMGLLSEDRKQEGLIVEDSIKNNATLTILDKITKCFVLDRKKEESIAVDILGKLRTKYGKLTDAANSLSGGNQQKVALSKWLASGSDLIILDEPTRGVDVGAKAEIYKNINDLAESGVAVIMISSEIEEVINMCDRAYVMREGVIAGELSKREMNEVNVMKLAVEG